MGWKDKNRKEQPKREWPSGVSVNSQPMSEPLPISQINSEPVPSNQTNEPVFSDVSVKPIPFTTNPRWCKPKSNCPAQWIRANAYAKVFLFPGSKIQISDKGGPDGKGVYRDTIVGECIWLYHNENMTRENPSGSTFIDDTTEQLFRQCFDFEGA